LELSKIPKFNLTAENFPKTTHQDKEWSIPPATILIILTPLSDPLLDQNGPSILSGSKFVILINHGSFFYISGTFYVTAFLSTI
jgi:hypothetical protein